MRRNDPLFHNSVDEATAWLMKEFIEWNTLQAELKAKGYEHNYYNENEADRMRLAFRAIAERFILEDIEYQHWAWFQTPWAGTDGNTGMEAYIIDFLPLDVEAGTGILAFYVTRNLHRWFAIPLAELKDAFGLNTYEVNSIGEALMAMW